MSRRGLRHRRSWEGFTLLEMLAVTAVISILAVLLSAALNNTKKRTHQFICLNNLRQLQVGWLMYVDDNQDGLPLNRSIPSLSAQLIGRRNTTNSWVAGNPKEDLNPSQIEKGSLFPYVKTPTVYRCPGDDSTVLGHTGVPRTRSYSMSAYMNGDDADVNTRVKTDFSEIVNPGPGRVFVLIEEHEFSGWNGSFSVLPTQRISLASTSVGSTPSDRHRQGCNLSFADGHIEYWKWLEPKKGGSIGLMDLHGHALNDVRRLQAVVPSP